MKNFILVTDLDNTLIGDNEATLSLQEQLLPLRDHFYLIYATGRNFDSVAHLMGFFQMLNHQSLLTPDYLVASVGTMIYHRSYLDPSWSKHIDHQWQRDDIDREVQGIGALRLQGAKEQNPWKLSFHLSHPHPELLLQQLREKFLKVDLACNIIFSSDHDVDIVPTRANKGLAVQWLQEKLGIASLPTLVCGDSGNDISMFEHNWLGVIVQNVQPELRSWYMQHNNDRILWAKASYAWAILEGLYHFQFL